jgi:nitroimidazol reductase NimA-like FMN-containing flavoprotein (pyridoxamine 5'-phosphate oxidase superfamily)
MRKQNQEITDRKTLEEILSKEQICRIAMNDDGKPYLLPLNYGYRNGCLYIHSAPRGRKIGILRKHPMISFEVEQGTRIIPGGKACNWTTLYRSVIGEGTVEIITDGEGKRKGLEVIMAQHGAPGSTEFESRELEKMVILKITITSMTGKHSSNWQRLSGEHDNV